MFIIVISNVWLGTTSYAALYMLFRIQAEKQRAELQGELNVLTERLESVTTSAQLQVQQRSHGHLRGWPTSATFTQFRRFGVEVTRWSGSTRLNYAEPG